MERKKEQCFVARISYQSRILLLVSSVIFVSSTSFNSGNIGANSVVYILPRVHLFFFFFSYLRIDFSRTDSDEGTTQYTRAASCITFSSLHIRECVASIRDRESADFDFHSSSMNLERAYRQFGLCTRKTPLRIASRAVVIRIYPKRPPP